MVQNSASETARRFDTHEAAAKYARSLTGSATHRREVRCIAKALHDLPRDSRVLDLPCGTGRFLPSLVKMGFIVTEADYSSHMLEHARQMAAAHDLPLDRIQFAAADALRTPFEDDAFDAVVCNRLLHHFREPDTRRAAFGELRRICSGPIVVSFFSSISWDGASFYARDRLRRARAADRIPIPPRRLREEAEEMGLSVERICRTRMYLSKQWYMVLRRDDDASMGGDRQRRGTHSRTWIRALLSLFTG